MTKSSDSQQLLGLPAEQRAGIADRLIESLGVVETPSENTWVTEVAARVAALRAGRIVTQDAFAALAELERDVTSRSA